MKLVAVGGVRAALAAAALVLAGCGGDPAVDAATDACRVWQSWYSADYTWINTYPAPHPEELQEAAAFAEKAAEQDPRFTGLQMALDDMLTVVGGVGPLGTPGRGTRAKEAVSRECASVK